MNDSTSSPAGRRRKSKGRRRALIAAIVVAAGGTWYGVHAYRASQAAKESGYKFAHVERGDIEDLVSSVGTLQPRDYVDVGAQVSGQIEDIFVEVGDVVEVGQKLVKIDATTSQARVDANTAQMESAKNNLLTQIANRDKAKRDYERQQNLYAEKATTLEQLINAETTYQNAERSVKSQQLSIAQNEANQRIEAKNLQYTTITAPIAGTVMKISVKKGQTVNASQSVPNVLQIANLGTMTVQSDVSEADVARLYKDNPVYFTTLGSGGGRRWFSTLKRVEPTAKVTNSVVTYNALFDIENEGDSLRPGMTTQVYFVINDARNVLKVPMSALQQGPRIARELAAKNGKDKKDNAKAPAAPGAPAGGAGGAVAPGSPSGPGASAAPAAVAANGAGNPGGAGANTTTAAPANDAGNRAANAGGNGNFGGRGGNGGGFGGAGGRGGGGFGGGGRGGANFQNMTPEQREEMRRNFANGNFGGGNFGGGNFGGGFNRQGGAAGTATGRQAPRTNGTVVVRKPDGTFETRRVVVGVTDRVYGEVIEGLEEGEEVVVGKIENEAAAAPASNNQQRNNNFQNFQGGRGNFQGGGNFRPF